jgi:hypothetical protein
MVSALCSEDPLLQPPSATGNKDDVQLIVSLLNGVIKTRNTCF